MKSPGLPVRAPNLPGTTYRGSFYISYSFNFVGNVLLLYLPTQIRFLIGGERVTCHWSKLNDALGKQASMFPSASPRGTFREVSGKQNSLFPLGPVIKCFLAYGGWARSTRGSQKLGVLPKRHESSLFFALAKIKTMVKLLWPLLIIN